MRARMSLVLMLALATVPSAVGAAPDDLKLAVAAPVQGALVERGWGFDAGLGAELRAFRWLGFAVEGRRTVTWWKPEVDGAGRVALVRGGFAGLAALRVVPAELDVGTTWFLAPLLEAGLLLERWASDGSGAARLRPGTQTSASFGLGAELGFVTPLDLRVPLVVRGVFDLQDDETLVPGAASGRLDHRWAVLTGLSLQFPLLRDSRAE